MGLSDSLKWKALLRFSPDRGFSCSRKLKKGTGWGVNNNSEIFEKRGQIIRAKKKKRPSPLAGGGWRFFRQGRGSIFVSNSGFDSVYSLVFPLVYRVVFLSVYSFVSGYVLGTGSKVGSDSVYSNVARLLYTALDQHCIQNFPCLRRS